MYILFYKLLYCFTDYKQKKKTIFYGLWEPKKKKNVEEERGGGDNSTAETAQKKPPTSPKREK